MEKSLILSILGGVYLGSTLSIFADTHYYMWQYWAIALPTIALFISGQRK